MPKHEWVLAICRNSTTRTDPNPGHTVYLDNLRPLGIAGKGMLACVRAHTISDSSAVSCPLY